MREEAGPGARALCGDSPEGPHVPPLSRGSAGLTSRHLKWLNLFKNAHLSCPKSEDGSFSAGVSGCSRVPASRRGRPPRGVITGAGLEGAPCSPNLSGPPRAKISTARQAFGSTFRSKAEAPGRWVTNVLDFGLVYRTRELSTLFSFAQT